VKRQRSERADQPKALGRLAAESNAELPWSVAEVMLADLIDRFGQDAGAAGTGAARAFTGLVPDRPALLDRRQGCASNDPLPVCKWRCQGKLPAQEGRDRIAAPLLADLDVAVVQDLGEHPPDVGSLAVLSRFRLAVCGQAGEDAGRRRSRS